MLRTVSIDPALRILLLRASASAAISTDPARQIISLAYGNAHLENVRVTRPMVESAYRLLERS
jgi:hypothetical protein